MSEKRIIRIKLNSGADLVFFRLSNNRETVGEDGVRICDESTGVCVDLPIGAQKALELFAMLGAIEGAGYLTTLQLLILRRLYERGLRVKEGE